MTHGKHYSEIEIWEQKGGRATIYTIKWAIKLWSKFTKYLEEHHRENKKCVVEK